MKKHVLLTLLLLSISCWTKAQMGKYKNVEEALENADQVIELQLSGITDPLPPTLGKLKNLKIVRLINLEASYDLADVFKKLAEIDGIEELYLYGNKQTALPPEITGIKNLRVIALSAAMKNNLEEALDLLKKLKNLEDLSLRGFKLTRLPDNIVNLKYLKSINLGDNPSLDYEQAFALLGQMAQLAHLNLDYNNIDPFPSSILKLKSLKWLDLEMMASTFNTAETYQILAKLDSLEHLNISGNFVGTIPNEIAELKTLKVLNINGNGIGDEATEKIKTLLPHTEIINDSPY